MARTQINYTSLDFNESSSTYGNFVNPDTTDYNYIACSDFSKLAIVMYNSDTAVCTISIKGITSTGDNQFVGKGFADLSTSVASSEIRWFGPFESAKFKSTEGWLWINSTSTAAANCRISAALLP
jgi:hypothetical protein